MTEPKNVIYDDQNIKTLDNLTAIRLRPAMYIESLGEMGLFKIDSEAVQNIFDEFLVGRGTSCFVDYDSVTNKMIIKDDASGIPIGKLVDIFTKSHTGGKFNREAYQISAGQNGIGNKLINALSTYLKVEVWREGYFNPTTKEEVVAKHAIVEFERGILKNEFYEDVPGSTKHGTTLEYYTDDEILKTHTRNMNRFAEYLNLNSYLLPGIYIELKIDGQKTIFQHTGGINELYVDRFIKGKKIKTIFDPIYVFGNEDMFSFEIVFSYNHLNSGDGNIVSAVNGNNTPMHGVHVSSFRAGASLALTDYVKENDDLIPKALKNVNMSGTLIGDNIVAVVTVKHRNPLYSGQTKEAFKSDEVQEPIKQTTRRVFGKWLRDNPQQAKKLVGIMIDYAKYEEERKKLKKNLIETKAVKSAFASNGIDPTKYTTCRSNNPEEKELFIVEGESAGGNVELAQDRQFQALYCLTGKILNTIKSGNMSKVILELIQALGMGLPGNGAPNYKNLQYHKIIILTDADDDGAHIATLLLAFLFKYYPKVIEDGHVFIANPPLKKLTMSNGKYFYIHTDNDYDRLMSEFIVEIFDMYSEKTKKLLSKGLFSEFIYHCRGYDILLKNHANSLAMNPDLLELIVVYINILTQCTGNINDKFNKQFKQLTGYDVRRDNEYYTFDKGVYHANLKMDLSFIEHHFDEISNKLNEIMIYGIYLKGKRSGKEYHGTIYTLLQIMNAILGPKIDIQRFKGLGEMYIEDLSETTINPMTRTLTQVTMHDAEKADKSMQVFMSDANIKFKRLYYSGKIDFD
jgi:DNA gyrase subunit B